MRDSIRTEIEEVITEQSETRIRPTSLKDYIGQEKIKESLKIYIEAAKRRAEPIDHILLYGPPGLGKTTLANIVAEEMGVRIRTTSGPAIEKTGELVAILSGLNQNDILFIDEIHRISKPIEEVLYSAMEDYRVDIVLGKEAQAKSISLELPKFTLIGATTRAGLLSSPLRDRFGIIEKMNYYSDEELSKIVKRTSNLLMGTELNPKVAREIASRSRGTPRLANRLTKRVRDFIEIRYSDITEEILEEILKDMNIDKLGLDNVDKEIISTINDRFKGGPVGLNTLAATIGEDAETIEDVYEPFLINKGLINRTPRGRVITEIGKEYLIGA